MSSKRKTKSLSALTPRSFKRRVALDIIEDDLVLLNSSVVAVTNNDILNDVALSDLNVNNKILVSESNSSILTLNNSSLNEHCTDDSTQFELNNSDDNSSQDFYTSFSDDDESYTKDSPSQIKDKIAYWALQYKVKHNALDALLIILKKYVDQTLPKCARTLLKTPRNTKVRTVNPGSYSHFGIASGLIENNTHQCSVVEYDDETIQIVPKCWVTIGDDGNMACYWPPYNFFSSNKRYISAVKKNMEAKPEWIKYGATILGTYVDEDETRVPKSTDSSVDSNNSNNTSVKKKFKVKSKLFTDESVDKIVKPRMIYDVDSSDEEDVSTLYHNKATTSEIQKPKEKTLFNASQHINKHLVNSYHQPESKGFRGSPVNHSKYQYKNDQNNYNSEIISNREFQEKVLKNLAFIKLTLKRLDEKISSVSMSQPDIDIDDEGIEDIFNEFPLSEEIHIINLEEKLKKDLSYKKKLMAVFKNAKDSKESDIITCIKNWLRHAEARYKNKLLKQKDDAANDLVIKGPLLGNVYGVQYNVMILEVKGSLLEAREKAKEESDLSDFKFNHFEKKRKGDEQMSNDTDEDTTFTLKDQKSISSSNSSIHSYNAAVLQKFFDPTIPKNVDSIIISQNNGLDCVNTSKHTSQSEILQNFYDNGVNLNVNDDNIILSSPLLPNQSIKTVLSDENEVGIKMQMLTKMNSQISQLNRQVTNMSYDIRRILEAVDRIEDKLNASKNPNMTNNSFYEQLRGDIPKRTIAKNLIFQEEHFSVFVE
ncbi:hypothetical protein ACI65C_013332 [Semiaphis heraclei]